MYSFVKLRSVPFISSLFWVFNYKAMRNFIEGLYWIYWNDHMISVLMPIAWYITFIDLHTLNSLCFFGMKDQPGSMLGLKAILLQGRNKFVSVYWKTKVCFNLFLRFDMLPHGVWFILYIYPELYTDKMFYQGILSYLEMFCQDDLLSNHILLSASVNLLAKTLGHHLPLKMPGLYLFSKRRVLTSQPILLFQVLLWSLMDSI